MAGSFTTTYSNTVLSVLTGKSPSVTRYIALFSSSPTNAGTVTDEVPDSNGYARKSTAASDWETAADGSISNHNSIDFAAASGDWHGATNTTTDPTHWGLMTAGTIGVADMLAWGTITTPKAIGNGDTVKFAANQLVITSD
jgi:hypothetical protein